MPTRVMVDVGGILVTVHVDDIEPIAGLARPIAVGDRVRFASGEYVGTTGEVRLVLAEE